MGTEWADDTLIVIISVIILLITYLINVLLSRLPVTRRMRSLFIIVLIFSSYYLARMKNPASEFMFAMTSVFVGTLVTLALLHDKALVTPRRRIIVIALIIPGPFLLAALGHFNALDERLILDMRASLLGSYMIFVLSRLIQRNVGKA